MQLAPMRSGSVLPEDRLDELVSPIVDSRAAGDGDRHAARVTIVFVTYWNGSIINIMRISFVRQKCSEIDDAREHPLLLRKVALFRQVPLRVSVKFPHCPQDSPL